MRSTFDDAYGPEQHGFRKDASTTTAFIQLFHIATNLYNNCELFGVAILSFDLSHAFDCVNPTHAIENLGCMKWFLEVALNLSL